MSDSNDSEKILGDNAGVYVPGQQDDHFAVDFGGFIVGLYQSALVSMGEVEHPDTQETYVDLDSARHTINILKMLHDKTRNNLDEEEARLLKGLLYKLRIAFVDAQKKHA